jgi:hypothetical protein
VRANGASYLTRAPIRLGSLTETPEGRLSVTLGGLHHDYRLDTAA